MLAVVLVGVRSETTRAQENATGIKIAVINLEMIRRNAKAVETIRDQIGKYRSTFQSEIQKEEEALRNGNQELARKRSILSAEAFADERRKFENRVTEVQKLVQGRKVNLDRAQAQAMGQVQDSLNSIVTKIAEENGLSLILLKDQTVLAVRELDITPTVLERLDAQLPTVTVTVVDK